jgi:hypothetical protein
MSLSYKNEYNFKIGDIIRYKYTENSDWYVVVDIKNNYLICKYLNSQEYFTQSTFHPSNVLLFEDSNAKLV